ncbi:MAG: hypothetical protein WC284_15345 [Candidimonas sp.]
MFDYVFKRNIWDGHIYVKNDTYYKKYNKNRIQKYILMKYFSEKHYWCPYIDYFIDNEDLYIGEKQIPYERVKNCFNIEMYENIILPFIGNNIHQEYFLSNLDFNLTNMFIHQNKIYVCDIENIGFYSKMFFIGFNYYWNYINLCNIIDEKYFEYLWITTLKLSRQYLNSCVSGFKSMMKIKTLTDEQLENMYVR